MHTVQCAKCFIISITAVYLNATTALMIRTKTVHGQ